MDGVCTGIVRNDSSALLLTERSVQIFLSMESPVGGRHTSPIRAFFLFLTIHYSLFVIRYSLFTAF